MAKNKSLSWEIITDILSRLAVKDLLRYRCVSKPWCSMIDSPYFIKLHLNHSKQSYTQLSALVGDNPYNNVSVDLNELGAAAIAGAAVKLNHPIPRGRYDWIRVCGSCNGLLVLAFWAEEFPGFILWNPSTKRYRKLPPCNLIPSCFLQGADVYGLGHDAFNDDYKFVKITPFPKDFLVFDQLKVKGEVYSSKANDWEVIKEPIPYYFVSTTDNGAFAGNALHWLVFRMLDGSNTYNRSSDSSILAFDLVTKKFCENVPQPPAAAVYCGKAVDENNVIMFLNVLGGSLCLTYNYVLDLNVESKPFADFRSHRVDIWVMKEYGVEESWTKLFTLKPSDDIESVYNFSILFPVAYWKSGDQVLLNKYLKSATGDHDQVVLNHQEGQRLITYHMRHKITENVKISGLPEYFRIFSCVGSLVGFDSFWNKGDKEEDDDKESNDEDDESDGEGEGEGSKDVNG